MSDDISLEPLLNNQYALRALEGYYLSDQINAATSYFGYLAKTGAWYIMRSIDVGGGEKNYTYAKGASGYNWANRAAETYAAFSITF